MFRLVKTCDACPEQYDAYQGDVRVGYLRLRWGYFRAELVADGARVVVYEASTQGDGCFLSSERDLHLNAACKALAAALAGLQPAAEPLLFTIEGADCG